MTSVVMTGRRMKRPETFAWTGLRRAAPLTSRAPARASSGRSGSGAGVSFAWSASNAM